MKRPLAPLLAALTVTASLAWSADQDPKPEMRLGTRNLVFAPRAHSLSVSADGATLAIGTMKGEVVLVGTRTFSVLKRESVPEDFTRVRFLREGSVVASGEWGARLFEPGTKGRASVVLSASTEKIRAFDASYDGSRLAYIKGQKTFLVDRKSKETRSVSNPGQGIWAIPWIIELSRDGSLLATATLDGGITAWDVPKEAILWSTHVYVQEERLLSWGVAGPHYAGPDGIVALAFSPHGESLAVGGERGDILVFGSRSGKTVSRHQMDCGSISALAFMPDGRSVAAGCRGERLTRVGVDGGVIFSTRAYPGGFQSLAAAPDGRRLYTLDKNGAVGVWDAATGAAMVDGMDRQVWGAAFSPDGTKLLSQGHDGTLELFSLSDGRRELRIGAHATPIVTARFLASGDLIASVGFDDRLRVWSSSGPLLWEARLGRVYIGSLGVSAGELVYSEDGRSLTSWDPASGRRLRRFAPHPGDIRDIAMTTDGRLIATGGDDGVFRLWDGRTGQMLSQWPKEGLAYTGASDVEFSADGTKLFGIQGHDRLIALSVPDARPIAQALVDGPLRAALPAPSGGWVLTAHDDRVLTRWTVKVRYLDGREKAVFKDMPGVGSLLALSPDARRFVTAGDDGRLLVWRVPK